MKNLIFILTFFIGIIFTSFAQSKSSADNGNQAKLINFYPNPASSSISFDFMRGYDKSFSFQVYNFIGKKIIELRSVAPKTVVDLTYCYRGVYIFQVRDKNGKVVESGRFTVER